MAVPIYQVDAFADEVFKAFIVRVDGNGRVPQHGFWTRGCHRNKHIAAVHRIVEVPELTIDILVDDFFITNG